MDDIQQTPPEQTPAPVESPVTMGTVGAEQPKRGRLWLTIVLGLVVAAALIGLAYMAYQTGQDEATPSNNTAADETTDTQPTLDTTSEVDETVLDAEAAELQSLINTNEDEDLPESELSDGELGL